MSDVCDSYGPGKWCNDPANPYKGDCPCFEEYTAGVAGYARAVADVAACLDDMADNYEPGYGSTPRSFMAALVVKLQSGEWNTTTTKEKA